MLAKKETKTNLNKSGIFPCGNHILVKPDVIEEKSKGGIIIPEEVKKRYQVSVSYGHVIAVGPDAFTHSVHIKQRNMGNGKLREVERTTIRYLEDFASPGDRICYALHSGRNYVGEDGEHYVQINDTDITARVTDGVTATHLEARKPLSQ